MRKGQVRMKKRVGAGTPDISGCPNINIGLQWMVARVMLKMIKMILWGN